MRIPLPPIHGRVTHDVDIAHSRRKSHAHQTVRANAAAARWRAKGSKRVAGSNGGSAAVMEGGECGEGGGESDAGAAARRDGGAGAWVGVEMVGGDGVERERKIWVLRADVPDVRTSGSKVEFLFPSGL